MGPFYTLLIDVLGLVTRDRPKNVCVGGYTILGTEKFAQMTSNLNLVQTLQDDKK